MIKKISAAVLSASMILGMNVAAAPLFTDIPEDSIEERVLNIVTGTGLMNGYEDGTFNPTAPVTRSEIATIICNALKTEYIDGEPVINWDSTYLGNSDKDTELLYAESERSIWSDVATNYWAYQAINYVNQMGIMNGDGNNTFRPDDNVTYNELVKTILYMNGYKTEAEYYGGYPSGYAKIASENGMSKGVSGTGSNILSRMHVARILYNSFNLPVRELKFDGTKVKIEILDDTFMNDTMNVYAFTGKLERTDVTSIDGEEPYSQQKASVSGVEFTFGDNTAGIRDMIGRDIRVFLYDDDGEYILMCYEDTGKDTVTVIDAELFDGYSSNTFTYYKTEDSNKTVKVKVSSGFTLIYNGKLCTSYDEDLFNNIKKGTITVVENKDGDTVIAESFESGYLSTINVNAMTVIDKLKEGKAGSEIDFSDRNQDCRYYIYDDDGNPMEFKDITKGAVNYYVNDGYIKMYCSSAKATGEIKGIVKKYDEQYITLDDVEYPVSYAFENTAEMAKLADGINVTCYLDTYGEITWVTISAELQSDIGFLNKIYINEDTDELEARFFDLATNEMKRMAIKNNVTFSDEYNNTRKVTNEGLISFLGDYKGIFAYEKNTSDVIRKIMLPLNENVKCSDLRLRQMLKMTSDEDDVNYMKNWNFTKVHRTFAYTHTTDGVFDSCRSIRLSATAAVMTVPSDLDLTEKYNVFAGTGLWEGYFAGTLYNFDEKSTVAQAMVLTDDGETQFVIPGNAGLYAVTEINEAYDEENDKIVKALKVSIGDDERTLIPNTDYVDFDHVKNAYASLGNGEQGYKIEVGDLVRFVEDGGLTTNIQLVYDADGKNPAWYGADPADRTTEVPAGNEDYTDITGTFAGSTGFHNSKYSNTNPFGYTNDALSSYPKYYGSLHMHNFFVYGFAYSFEDDKYLTITTQNLKNGFSGELDKANYYYETFDPSIVWGVRLVKYKGSKVTVEMGSISDIKTYAQKGKNCSKLIATHTMKWSPQNIYILINE